MCLQLQQASAEQTQESAATLQTAERRSERHRSWLGVWPTQPPPASPSCVGNQIQQSGSLGKTFYLYVTQFKELFSWQIAETSSLWECEASWGPVKSNSNNSLLFSAFEYQLVSKEWSTWSSLTANRFYWCESNWSNWTRRLCIKFAGWTNERGEKFNQLFNNHNSHPQYTQVYFKFIYIYMYIDTIILIYMWLFIIVDKYLYHNSLVNTWMIPLWLTMACLPRWLLLSLQLGFHDSIS